MSTTQELPSGDQIRTWLRTHNWTLIGTGSAGDLWLPPNRAYSVGVLHSYEDMDWAATGAIERIADRVGRAAAEVQLEMLTGPAKETAR